MKVQYRKITVYVDENGVEHRTELEAVRAVRRTRLLVFLDERVDFNKLDGPTLKDVADAIMEERSAVVEILHGTVEREDVQE